MKAGGCVATCASTAVVAAGASAMPASDPPRTGKCTDFKSQKAAQTASNTRDSDGDGFLCESLPCPCATGFVPPPYVRKPRPKPNPASKPLVIRARISYVADGDTLTVKTISGGSKPTYKVRLIGLDSPETRTIGGPVECGGRRSAFNMFRIAYSHPKDTKRMVSSIEPAARAALGPSQPIRGWIASTASSACLPTSARVRGSIRPRNSSRRAG